jgi:hypothetical protein
MSFQVTCKIFSAWILFIVSIWGCTFTKTSSSTTLPSSAYFVVDPSELKSLHALARMQEARMKGCPKSIGCEDAYYIRGLVALFENRADAINMFQELRTTIPNGRYAAASTRWLYLLQTSSPRSSHNATLLDQLRHEVLHVLLDREEVTVSRRMKD